MWTVLFGKVFEQWLLEQEEGLQDKVLADLLNLQKYGPRLPRPYADTVKGSWYNHMKELRINMLDVRYVLSSHLILSVRPLCFARAIRVTTKPFMKK